MNEKNKVQAVLVLELWETIIKETRKLMNQSQEEARTLNEKGLSLLIVSEEAFGLTDNLKDETKKLQFLMTQDSALLQSNMENCMSTMLQAVDKLDMLSLNGKVEATRAKDDGKDFRVIFEELSKLAGHMNQTILELKKLILGNEEISPAKNILGLLNKTNNQVNLLAVNYIMEAARLGENGESIAVISHELKKLTSGIQNLTKELEMVLENQK